MKIDPKKNIELVDVTKDNFLDVISLTLSDSQSHLVPLPTISIAKTYIKPDGDDENYLPKAISVDDKIVGFVLLIYNEKYDDNFWISGLMIDKNQQSKQYGTNAILTVIEYYESAFPNCTAVQLTVLPDNKRAISIYERIGFKNTGRIYEGEIIFKRVKK